MSFSAQMNCDCGGGKYNRCGSRYSCLKIYIQYDLPNNETVYAQMFESEFELRGNEVRIAYQFKHHSLTISKLLCIFQNFLKDYTE